MQVMNLHEKITIQNFNCATRLCALEAIHYLEQFNDMLDLEYLFIKQIIVTAGEYRLEVRNQKARCSHSFYVAPGGGIMTPAGSGHLLWEPYATFATQGTAESIANAAYIDIEIDVEMEKLPIGSYGSEHWKHLLEKTDSEELRENVGYECIEEGGDEPGVRKYSYGLLSEKNDR